MEDFSDLASWTQQRLLWLQRELDAHLCKKNPQALQSTLEVLAQVGQAEGDLQLSLRAQSMREFVCETLFSDEALLSRVSDLHREISTCLTHLTWKKECASAELTDPMPRG